MNKDAIAVDQDKLGKQGYRVSAQGATEIWEKPLSDGSKAVGLFNRGDSASAITLDLKSVGFGDGAKLHDIWAGKDVMATGGSYTVQVPTHGAVLLKVWK